LGRRRPSIAQGVDGRKFELRESSGLLDVAGALHFGAARTDNPARYPLSDLPAQFLLLHAFIGERLTFNFPSWSLSAEMFCYLLFPAVALIAQRRKEAIIALVAFTALANSLWAWAAGTTPWADWINQGGAFRALPDDAFRQRPEPEVKRTETEQEARRGEHVLDPIAAEPAQVEHDDERCGRRQCKQGHDERTCRQRIAGHVEPLPEPIERRQHEQPERGFLEVETLGEMRHGQTDDEDDAELPRTPPPPGERARQPDERQPERQRGDASRSGDAGREHPAHEVRTVGELRSESGDNARDTDRRSGPTEHELPAKSAKPHAPEGTWENG